MKKLIAFDLDDTLADSKSPLPDEMVDVLVQLSELYRICVISGGTFNQIRSHVLERLPQDPAIQSRFFPMAVNGAEYYTYDSETSEWVQQYALRMPDEDRKLVAEVLERCAKELGYWEAEPTGDIIEDRGAQVTFSALGQKATPAAKHAWDADFTKRHALHSLVSRELPGYEVRINGNTSLDVTLLDIDKGYGIKQLMAAQRLDQSEILFIGDQLYEQGNDFPVKALGIDTVDVTRWQDTLVIINDLLAKREIAVTTIQPVIEPIGTELQALVERFIELHVTSRDDLQNQVTELVATNDVKLIDTPNTKAFIIVFNADNERYGIKLDFGDATALRDEVRWYELAPRSLKHHLILPHMSDSYAFVLLRWLVNSKTIEEIAIENEGRETTETIDLVIRSLEEDKHLFENNATFPLPVTRDSNYFLDKYRDYNAADEDFPYLEKLIKSHTVRLNGKELPGPERYVLAVSNNDRLREYLSPELGGLIHGDAHMDNLLVEGGVVYMVDPKGTDPLPLEYDHGRVLWSLTGWNAIVRGEFELSQDEDGYHLSVAERQQYRDGLPRIREYFTEQGFHRALYSAALQYVTRIHHASEEAETTALYLRGLQIFDDLFTELGVQIP